jgi:molybdate transport system substrate-binding protein
MSLPPLIPSTRNGLPMAAPGLPRRSLPETACVRWCDPGFVVNTDSLLDSMLRVDVRLGMSTPKADPSGDYALALFERAGAIRPGAREALAGKALQLTGGPTSMAAPPGRNLYAWVMEQGSADIFLTYCTNAVAARRDRNSLQVVQVPAALQVGASYGLTYRQGCPRWLPQRSPGRCGRGAAQNILARHGFARP